MENEILFRKVYGRVPAKLFYKLHDLGVLGGQFDAILTDLLLDLVKRLEEDGNGRREFEAEYGIRVR